MPYNVQNKMRQRRTILDYTGVARATSPSAASRIQHPAQDNEKWDANTETVCPHCDIFMKKDTYLSIIFF